MKKLSFFAKIKAWVSTHKISSFIILIIVIGGGYYTYKKTTAANAAPQYVLSPVRIGTITQTVTGGGQVSAENQLDVTSEVSGKIQSINVTVGQHVSRGTLLATIDSHDAAISLESARIAYAKLVKPAKSGDLTNAQNTLAKAYNDGFAAVSTTYLDLPSIMTGMKDLLYSRDGFLSDQKSTSLVSAARAYRDTAGISYDKALIQYQNTLDQYKNLTRASATSSIDSIIANTYTTLKMAAVALQNIQNTVTYVVNVQPEYQATIASATAANIASWSNQVSSDLSGIVSAQNSITSNDNTLNTLLTGAEDLDIQSQRLSLQQAEETYAKYFIRAPFDGVVGRIPVSVYGQASASTVIVTIASDQKITTIPLNEVDAVKVQKENKVKLTFDALSGLSIDGKVVEVDLVGTASQGVVTYNVKIAFDGTDPRVRTGMSVDATIITEEKTGILVVPSTAIKGQGQKKYVEVLDDTTVSNAATANATNSTRTNRNISSTTSNQGNLSTTTNRNRQNQSITISSKVTPRQITVVTGDSDDLNTEIISGLEKGQLIIVRTTAGNATTAQAAAPSILSSFGGNQRAGGGAVRTISR